MTRALRCLFLAGIVALPLAPGRAEDQILFKNGTRISGTILGQSKDQVFMRIGHGNVVYSKKAIRRIYDDITSKKTFTRVLAKDELPPWWVPLSDLFHEDWVNSLESISATVIDNGELQNIPYLSFRANGIYEMNIYGNPDDPAAIEIGYRGRGFHSHDALKRCRQFMVSYLTGLDQLQALYALGDRGGRRSAGGLDIKITPPGAPDAYGGWWVAISNPAKLAAARMASEEQWKLASEKSQKEISRWTDGETSWRKYSLQDAIKRYVPMERMEEN